MFISGCSPTRDGATSGILLRTTGIPYTNRPATRSGRLCGRPILRSTTEQIGRNLLTGVDQALHRSDRLVERLAVLAGQLDLDHALDAPGADHDGHADIHVLHAEL